MHVSGLRRRPVGVALAEVAKLTLLASGDLAELVVLGVREPAPVVLAVAAVERVHAEAHEAVVAAASVRHGLQLLGEVVLVRLELDLRVSVLAPPEPALHAVDEVVAEAVELVHDGLVLGEVLGDVLDDVLVFGASAGRGDRGGVSVRGDHRPRVVRPGREHGCLLRRNLRRDDRGGVSVRGDHRPRVVRPGREHGCHLRRNLRHLGLLLLLELRLLERRLRLRQRQLVRLLHCRDLRGVLLLEDLEVGHGGSHDDRLSCGGRRQ